MKACLKLPPEPCVVYYTCMPYQQLLLCNQESFIAIGLWLTEVRHWNLTCSYGIVKLHGLQIVNDTWICLVFNENSSEFACGSSGNSVSGPYILHIKISNVSYLSPSTLTMPVNFSYRISTPPIMKFNAYMIWTAIEEICWLVCQILDAKDTLPRIFL